MNTTSNKKTEKTKELVSLGAEVTGAMAGSVIGLAAAGPVGAIGGAIAGPVLAKSLEMLADFALRELSNREKIKVGAGFTYAYTKIVQYLDEGSVPRDDGFFEKNSSSRSPSDEILEGMLFKCRNEHEEKKLRLMGNIYANTAFNMEISAFGANWLLKKVQELTYRQLCIIALIEKKKEKGVSWGPKDGDPAFEIEYEQIDSMFARDHSSASVESYNETGEGLWVKGLSRVGKFCFTAMGLNEIPEEDLKKLECHFPRAFN